MPVQRLEFEAKVTRRLYYDDSYIDAFGASAVKIWAHDAGYAVVLDRTAFYPTSGGQPHDTGFVDGARVIDVSEEGPDIIHIIDREIALGSVHATLDWSRRFDHMQQHSGQHVLSQAFLRELGAQTISFHLGERTSTIDLDVSELSSVDASGVENAANDIVLRNLPITSRFIEGDEAATATALRRHPVVHDRVRIVAVAEYDQCPCGGTHVRATGEIGPILIRRLERQRQHVRVEFMCGWRSIKDHQWRNATILRLAESLSVGEDEVEEALSRLQDEGKQCQRVLRQYQQRAVDLEAQVLLATAVTRGNLQVISSTFADRDQDEVRLLALALRRTPATVSLLGNITEVGRLVFARSDDLSLDMNRLVSETCVRVGGGGGGAAHLAQGGGLPGTRIAEALEFALGKVIDWAADEVG